MEPRNQSSSFRLAAILAEILLCAISGTAFAQGDAWQPLKPMPTPRRLLAAAAHDHKIYTFGGCGSPCFQPPLHTSTFEETLVEVYDTKTRDWSRRAPMPTILFGAVAVAPGNGKIYTFGGYVSGDVVQEYNPATDEWKRKSPMPTARYGLAAVALDGKVYVLGGSGPSNALEVYDPATDSWTRKAPMPTARVFLGAATVDDKIYAIGGSPDCCGNSQTDAVEIYDPVTDSWSRGAPLPVAQQVSAAAGLNGKVYVFGGFVPGVGPQGTTFEYTPETKTWTARARFPEPRDQAPAVVIDERVHILGGSVACHCRALGDHHEYTPPSPPATADLGIEKGNRVDRVFPGQRVRYTIVVTNLGAVPVTGAAVQDFFPPQLTEAAWTCTATPGASCTPAGPAVGAPINDSAVNLPVGGRATYVVNGTIDPTATGEVSNRATVRPPPGVDDSEPGNNTSVDTDLIEPCGLSISKTDDRDSASPLDTLVYRITVRNLCPAAVFATVTDDLSAAGLIDTRWCVGAPCTPSVAGNLGHGITVPAQGAVTYVASGVVPATCGLTQITNTACVAVAGETRDCAVNVDSISVPPDLSITKSDGREEAAPGDRLVYTIVVSNPGPASASATVTDDLSATGLSDVRWCRGAGCTPSPAGNIAETVAVPALGAVTYVASGVVPATGGPSITNTACVEVACKPRKCASDTTARILGPEPPLDLSISKTDGLEEAAPGDRLVYTIVARNKGDRPVAAAPLTDILEPALEQVQWCCGSAPTCAPAQAGALPATLDLPANGTQTCVVSGCLSPLFTGMQSNTATLMLPPPDVDPTPADNTAVDLTRIGPPLGVTALCAGFNGFVVEGETITFTFVLWNGGAAQVDAPGPEFVDTLPAGLTLVSASADSGTVTTAANTVNWDGPIPEGGRVVIMVTATVDPGTAGATLCNPATVSFDSDGDGLHDTSRLSGSPCHPCCVQVFPTPLIPALSGPGLAALVLLLAALAALRLRKERQPG